MGGVGVLSASIVIGIACAVFFWSLAIFVVLGPLLGASFVAIRPDALHVRTFYSDNYFRWEHIGYFSAYNYRPERFARVKIVVWDYDGPRVHASTSQQILTPDGLLWSLGPGYGDSEHLATQLEAYRHMYTRPKERLDG